MPHKKVSYQAVNTNFRPISKPSRVTPPKNQNINNSHSLATKKDGRKKLTMPTTVLILPRPTSGKTQLRFNAKFDMSRAKALLSEDVYDCFGELSVVKYPGPIGIEDANGEQINFIGEVMFKINILERVTTVSAWVTNEIPENRFPQTIRKGGQYPIRSETSPSKITPTRNHYQRRKLETGSYYPKLTTAK